MPLYASTYWARKFRLSPGDLQLQGVVGPDDKGNTELVHVLLHGHLILGDPVGLVQERLFHELVVAEHDDDGGLVALGEVIHQSLEGLIRLVGQGEVLLGHGIYAGLVGQLYLGGVVLHGVTAVVLNGDIKEEERLSLLLVLKLPDDLLKVGLVAHVAVLHSLGHVHVLTALKAVKAQQGVGLVALPEVRSPGWKARVS